MGIDIEKELGKSGFKMLGDDEEINRLIIKIIESKNERYLKAIPYLIYKYDINPEDMDDKLKNKELFEEIMNITKRIFADENIPKKIKVHSTIKISKFNYDEFLQEFKNQKSLETIPNLLLDKQKMIAERNLEFSLSRIFTKKEKEIIKKMLNDKTLTKTEYEYYSRKTKKKLESIISLADFAKAMYTKKAIKE